MKEKYLTKSKFYLTIFTLLTLLFVVMIAAPLVGSVSIDLKKALFKTGEATSTDAVIFWDTRLPRVILAVLVGAILSVTGCVFQSLLRNPLATPYILGISSGGSFGVVLCILLGINFVYLGISGQFIAAFIFSMCAMFLVYYLSRVRGNLSTTALLLAGVTINFFFASAILLIQYLSNPSQSFQMIRWMMGGVDTIGFKSVKMMLAFSIPGIVILSLMSKRLNLIAISPVYAVQVGVDVDKTRKFAFFISSIITAAAISVCGPIGFVGLIIPHLLRFIIGSDNRLLVPCSAMAGGIFLLICDTIGRSAGLIFSLFGLEGVSGSGFIEIPVGVITSMCGGPFFIFLLLKKKHTLSNME